MAQAATIQSSNTTQPLPFSLSPIHSVGETDFVTQLEVDHEYFKEVTRLYFKNHLKLVFKTVEKYHPHFALLKGLLEFSRAKDIVFVYNREAKSFEVSIEEKYLHRLISYLKLINSWMKKEILFKEKLKVVIQFEAQCKAAQAQLFGMLAASGQ